MFFLLRKALRHSKVKLTWDDDDVERTQVTRRMLTRQQIEENDFKAYIASSGSSSDSASESEADGVTMATTTASASKRVKVKENREERRSKLRSLLLSGDNDGLPEGWGGVDAPKGDIEVTFAPGLSNSTPQVGDVEEETTLERYKRRQREKKAARKAAQEARAESTGVKKGEAGDQTDIPNTKKKHRKAKDAYKEDDDSDFVVDVTDSRFKSLHEDPDFAIDPSHPQCVFLLFWMHHSPELKNLSVGVIDLRQLRI